MKRTHSLALLLLLLVFTAPAIAQSKTYTLHGKVISFEESLALEGATVRLKGTAVVTGTQADGTFSIDVPGTRQVLVIQLTSYETQEIKLGEDREIDIALKAAASAVFLPSTKIPFSAAQVPCDIDRFASTLISR